MNQFGNRRKQELQKLQRPREPNSIGFPLATGQSEVENRKCLIFSFPLLGFLVPPKKPEGLRESFPGLEAFPGTNSQPQAARQTTLGSLPPFDFFNENALWGATDAQL